MSLTAIIAKAIEAEAERQFDANPNAIETCNNIVNDDGIMRLDLYGRYDLTAMCAAIEDALPPSDFEHIFQDACTEAGCGYDNELLLTTIKEMRNELHLRRAAEALGHNHS